MKYGRNFKHFNQNEFEEELRKINWETILDGSSTDEAFNKFFLIIEHLLNEMAPVHKLSKKESDLQKRPWITNGLLKSMKSRDQLYKDFTKEKNESKKAELFSLYKRKRNLIISLIRSSKKDYFASYFEEHKSNIRKTWEGVRNLVKISKKSNIIPTHISHNNEIKTTNKEMAETMNDFFVNIGNMVEGKIPVCDKTFSSYLSNPNPDSIFLNPVDNDEIISFVNQLKPNKACGPNSIPNSILKNNILYLAEPIKIIVNMSFNEGVVPNLMKLADVCPIFKKSDKSKCENYRPISLLSNISKIFERSMYTRVYEFFEKSNVLYNLQFGFRKSYSTNHALLNIVEEIRTNLDRKTFSCGVFVDLEKAFDTVNHKILITKLNHYGVRGTVNNWFLSYLSQRQQRLTLNGSSSPYLDISCGVPQGSILGPLLFLVYINDMHEATKHSIVHHFADDTNLLCSSKDPKDLRKKLNEDLRLLYEWLCSNRLSLNVSKTEFIIFKPAKKVLRDRITLRLNGVTLFESRKIKYLGLIMDDKLSWKHHVNELRKKLNRTVGIIYGLKKYCNESILKSMYYALFHSYLMYGLSIWGLASRNLTKPIQLLQKKVIRIITNSDYLAHTQPLFKSLKILNFHDMINHQTACLMWDQDHDLLPVCFTQYFQKVSKIHGYNTRMSHLGKLSENIRIRTDTHGRKLLKFYGPRMLNYLKDQSFYSHSNTKNSFSRRYKEFLFDKY